MAGGRTQLTPDQIDLTARLLEPRVPVVLPTNKIKPGIIADYDANGHIVGIEILAVSKRGNTVSVKQAA